MRSFATPPTLVSMHRFNPQSVTAMCKTCAIRRHQPALALLGALALAAFALLTASAPAATTNATATLTSGNLSISQALTAGAFAGTLSGAAQSLSATPAAGGTAFGGFQIRDARGSGVGWSVTASASRLLSGSGHAFALGSLTMPALDVVGEANSSLVPGTLHGAAAIDNSADGSTGGVVMAATSADGQGMGAYDFTNAGPWTLAVPANAFAGTYASIVTTTLATLSLGQSTDSTALFSSDFSSMAGLTPLIGTWAVVNGQLVPTGVGEHRLGFGSTAWTDVSLSVTATLRSGRGYGIYYRDNNRSSLSGYCFQYDPGLGNVFEVRLVTNGVESTHPIAIAPMPPGFAVYGTPHQLSVKVVGDHHVLSVDGARVLDFHEGTYLSGAAGLRSWDANNVGFSSAQVLSGGGTGGP